MNRGWRFCRPFRGPYRPAANAPIFDFPKQFRDFASDDVYEFYDVSSGHRDKKGTVRSQ